MLLADLLGPDLIIVIIVVAVVVLIGGARLPKIARNLGSAKSEFEKGVKEGAPAEPATAPDEPTK